MADEPSDVAAGNHATLTPERSPDGRAPDPVEPTPEGPPGVTGTIDAAGGADAGADGAPTESSAAPAAAQAAENRASPRNPEAKALVTSTAGVPLSIAQRSSSSAWSARPARAASAMANDFTSARPPK